MAKQSYTYKPLASDREIRLFDLLPGLPQSPLRCDIRHVPLDSKPAYECLSYCWGPEGNEGELHCGESTLDLYQNLDAALQRLRHADLTRTLWVDRISISQTDNDEKSSQVALMGEIFSTASRVICWVGEEDGDSHGVFDFVEKAYNIAAAIIKSNLGRFEEPNDLENYNSMALDGVLEQYPSPGSQWTALERLLKRDWFSRVWILQESVVAPRAILRCGSYELPFYKLVTVLTITTARPSQASDPPLWDCTFAQDMCRTRLMYKGKAIPEPGIVLSLISLLSWNRSRGTTERSDKIYAMLNIACDLSSADKAELRPDYNKKWQSVYTETARWSLRHYQDLRFLKLVEIGNFGQDGLPSWVPNFNVVRNQMNFLYQSQTITQVQGKELYRCTGAAKARELPTNNSAMLCLEGICLDVITKVSDPPGNLTGNIALNPKVLDGGEWEKFAKDAVPSGIYPPTNENIHLAYSRLRCGDLYTGNGNILRRERRHPPESLPTPGQLYFSSSTDSRVHGDRRDIANHILTQTTRRRLLLTEKGYLGLAKREIKVEDKVYLLLGGDMLFILRPKGHFYQFMGEAYVHGFMDGEALVDARVKSDPSYDETDVAWLEKLDTWQGSWPFETEKVMIE